VHIYIHSSYPIQSKMFLLSSPSLVTALSLSTLSFLAGLAHLTAADSAGYYLPSSGVASTTQFYLGPELSSGGTACSVKALPNGKSTSGKQGSGPGYFYVRRVSFFRSHLANHSVFFRFLPSCPLTSYSKS
jgi:hypothetical protein